MSQAFNPVPYITPQVTSDQLQQKRRRLFRRLTVIAIFCVLLLSIAVFVLYRLALLVGLAEHPFHQKAASQAVAQIVNGTLKPAPNGVVTLPPALASASLDGKAYVTVDSTGVTWVLFQTWRGKGANLRGYVYHSNTAPSPPPATVKILGPAITVTQLIDYNVESQEGPNWYRVSWDLD